MTREARGEGDEVAVVVRIPRAALQIVEPVTLVSQLNAERVLGLSRRQFLGDAQAFERDGGSVIRRGKLRLVELAPFVAWLRTRSAAAAAEAPPDAAPREEPDSYAASLGLRVVRGGR